MRKVIKFFLPLILITVSSFGQDSDTTLHLYFATGNASPIASGLKDLESWLSMAGGKVDSVFGYADSVGTKAFNLDLSNRRCISVITLLRKDGVVTGNYFLGKGEVASDSGADLAFFRRVDIIYHVHRPNAPRLATFEIRTTRLDRNDIQFLPDIAGFQPSSLIYLPDLLRTLNQFPHAHYTILGYVNWIPAHPENRNSGFAQKMRDLSEERARAIYEWLADNGMERSRMSYEGRTNDSLVYSHPQSLEEKERNMRVQIIVEDSVAREGRQ